MSSRSPGEPGLGSAGRARLARGLDLVEEHTDAPVMLRGHSSARGHQVFELQEYFEVGARAGRRFLVSVRDSQDLLLIAMDGPA